ncbi:TPA: hypothetical protein ROY01_003933 [Bacillus toyonensis]|nr:hypothetical protein [Bacillus toyonensis]
MQLTKLEKAIAIGTILQSIGEGNLEYYVELESLRPVVRVLDRVSKRTKPKERKEATISLIGKLMHDLSKENDYEKIVRFRCAACGYTEQYTERQARTKDGLRCKQCVVGPMIKK